MSRRLQALCALALVAVIGAACGSNARSAAGPGAPAAPATGGTGTAAGKSATDQDKAVRFAECIRGHGVPHFPDPDAKGEYVFGIDVSPAVWQKAVGACKDLEPPGAL